MCLCSILFCATYTINSTNNLEVVVSFVAVKPWNIWYYWLYITDSQNMLSWKGPYVYVYIYICTDVHFYTSGYVRTYVYTRIFSVLVCMQKCRHICILKFCNFNVHLRLLKGNGLVNRYKHFWKRYCAILLSHWFELYSYGYTL